jgi:hypothetical protein
LIVNAHLLHSPLHTRRDAGSDPRETIPDHTPVAGVSCPFLLHLEVIQRRRLGPTPSPSAIPFEDRLRRWTFTQWEALGRRPETQIMGVEDLGRVGGAE